MEIWEYFLDISKDIVVEAIKWSFIVIVGYIASKIPFFKRFTETAAISRRNLLVFLLAVATIGFINSLIGITYTYISISRLSEWGRLPEEIQTPVNINGGYGPVTATCPSGYYVVGVTNYGNTADGKCIGCFVGVQLSCRKINN